MAAHSQPIFAMTMGLIPLIFAHGAGAISPFDIGLVIKAGMAVGTIFTLFITAAIFTFFRKTTAGATSL